MTLTTRAHLLPLSLFLSLFLLSAGCDSAVDLELDLRGRPPSATSPPALDWSAFDSGSRHSEFGHVDWVADGSVAVAGALYPVGPDNGVHPAVSYLARFGADGTALWSQEIEGETLSGEPLPGDGDALVEIDPLIGAIDTFEDGRTVVAIDASTSVIDDGVFTRRERSFLQWYGGDGSLLQTRALDATDGSEAVIRLQSVLALPDGGVVFSGASTSGPGGPDPGVGMEITGSVLGRLNADGTTAWTVPVGDSESVPNLGPEETISDLSLTPDGGLVFRGHFSGELAIGDKRASAVYGAYVARLELDGSCTWLRTFDEVDGLQGRGGVAVASSGHLVAIGFFTDFMQVEDFQLEGPEGELTYFLVEMDASGAVLSLNQLEPLPPALSDENDAGAHVSAMALDGDQVVTAGGTHEGLEPDHNGLQGPYVARHDLGGALLDARLMSVIPPGPDDQGSAEAVEVAPDGRVAVTGRHQGQADFGDGPVSSGAGLTQGFIAVYDASAASDVD